MLLRNMEMFTLKDVEETAKSGYLFKQRTKGGLAGRCLLDSVEYLLTHPKFPGQFRQVANAHSIRLIAVCLSSDRGLQMKDLFDRIAPRLGIACEQLLKSRSKDFPFYGDDFWDWAAILECFLEMERLLPGGPINGEILDREFESFKEYVEKKLADGLRAPGPAEWYGPATATAAYRVLRRWGAIRNRNFDATLERLKEQSLEPIDENGRYRGHPVRDDQLVWHLGQVVAQFAQQAAAQWDKLRQSLLAIKKFTDRSQPVYALARVVQGAHAIEDTDTFDFALTELYEFEQHGRPLGEGIIGDNVKGSLNVLEGLWFALSSQDKSAIREMLQALRDVHNSANTVAIVVAIPREADAIREAFTAAHAEIEERGNAQSFVVRHPDYRVVVRQSKGLIASTDQVGHLLDEDKPKWVIMCGIAGSLGTTKTGKDTATESFVGPDLGDVVLAVSLASYQIRDKIRGSAVENVGVPLGGTTWKIIPVDAKLFAQAHAVAEVVFPEGRTPRVWEGQIVTSTGIRDDLGEKAAILAEFPGGLAIEEEGFVVALFCMSKGTPCIVIRGISDRAEGDKIKRQQNSSHEGDECQRRAAANAAKVAFETVKRLSSRW